MKAIIFAGGTGTRLWPLSRKRSPKQFEKVIGDKSTLQLAVERLLPEFSWEDIYISTGKRYVSTVKKQLPQILSSHVIGEPETRDVGPAVGLMIAYLYKYFPTSPIVILWCDHIVKKVDRFKHILTLCGSTIQDDPEKIIFISQKPRFASQNLGWIKYGTAAFEKDDLAFHTFECFHYRPTLDEASEFFKSGNYTWNLGYFVTTPVFLWKLFKEYQPHMFSILEKIHACVGTDTFETEMPSLYHQLPKISFDNAILEKIDKKRALVVSEDVGWSDVGAWEALKEALQTTPTQNVTAGKVLLTDCQDSLVYNYTDQLVVTIDMKGFLVVNTADVVLICHKNSVPKIKKLVEGLAQSDNGHLV